MPEGHPLLPEDPARLGAYRLVGRLGEGSQGVVYLARDAAGTHVAIKLLHARMAAHADTRERFVRELAAAKKVARFCTAQVLDADVAGDHPYIVSEYVEGRSLRAHIRTDGPRSGGALERLAISTLTALAAIHKAGVVHRDFTPHNVLLGPDGPRVIDFGIARALGAARSAETGGVGTPAYMAPEQVAARPVGPPADMFAWGATILFAATGRPPFGNESVPAVMDRVLHAEPDVTVLPEPLRSVVAACLAKDPAARPTAEQAQAGLLGREAGAAMTPPPAFGAASGPSGGHEAKAGSAGSPVDDGARTVPTPMTGPPAAATPGVPDSAGPASDAAAPARSASAVPTAETGVRASAGAAPDGGASAAATAGAAADRTPPPIRPAGPGGPQSTDGRRTGRAGRSRRVHWAVPVSGVGSAVIAVLVMIAWPDGGGAAPPPARTPMAAAPATPSPTRPPAERLMTRSVRRPSPTPKAKKKKKKHPSQAPADGCHDYSRTYGVPQAGSAILKVTVCRDTYSGTTVLTDTAPKDGWDVCLQLRGHVPEPDETYISTIRTSRDGRTQTFSNGPAIRFGAGSHRSEDWVLINIGRCQGSGTAIRPTWEARDRLAAG